MKFKIKGFLLLLGSLFISLLFASCLSMLGIKTLDLKTLDKSQPIHIGKIAYSVDRGDTLKISSATGQRKVAPDKLPLVYPMLEVLLNHVDDIAIEFEEKYGITLDVERFDKEFKESTADNFLLRDLPSGTRTELSWEPEKQDNPVAIISAGDWYPEIQVGIMQNKNGQNYAKILKIKK